MNGVAWKRGAIAGLTAGALIALSGCGGGSTAGSTKSQAPASSGASGTFSSQEVATGSKDRVTTALFAVPKGTAKLKLRFLNPGLSVPTFKDWETGMKDAAAFYGQDLLDVDLNMKTDAIQTAYDNIAVKGVDVLGGGAGRIDDATLAAAKRDKVPVVLIDQSSSTLPWFGVDDAQVGTLAAEQMLTTVKQRLSGPWKGAKIKYIGLSAANCVPCDARVKAGAVVFQKELGLGGADVTLVAPDPGTADKIQAATVDYLTAHPNDKVIGIGFAAGAVKAAVAEKRTADVLIAGLGGDSVDRSALRDPANKDVFVGAVDFNPYAEGWNWVEAAIATKLGQKFTNYKVARFLTPQNVNEFYKD